MTIVALIPARAGSKRIPHKNTRLLGGQPLIAWTLAAAQQSGIFTTIKVCTDDEQIAQLAGFGSGWLLQPRDRAPDDQPDIVWVREALTDCDAEAFAILRPTSPFRTADTIRRAFASFRHSEAHSLRAVEIARHHPGKMWRWAGPGYPITPVIDQRRDDGTPWHSSPTQSLPTLYIQNASLEMAWTYVVRDFGTISGTKIAPFFTEGYEGINLDWPEDFARAEALVASGAVTFPAVGV